MKAATAARSFDNISPLLRAAAAAAAAACARVPPSR